VIYYPGGGWVSQNEGSISPLFTNLTAFGYAVVSANYVASSYARWPAQIHDAKAAVRWVRANASSYGFDPNRVAVAGTSSGGHMAAYVGASGGRSSARIGSETIDLIGTASGNLTQSDVVQVAAPFYPPTDLLAMDHYPTPDVPDHNAASSPESNLIGTPIQTVPAKTATANPLIFTRPVPQIPSLPPFWIVHGSADRSVQFNQSERLNAALVNNGQRSIFWPVLGAGHGTGVIDSQEVHSLFRGYLDRTLLGITSNAAPVPRIVANVLTGTAPLTVNLDGSTSTDSDGVITKYSWSSGDNTGGGNPSLSVTFSKPGIYPVTLAVRDDLASTGSTTINIIVNPANTPSATPPSANVTAPIAGAVYSPTGDLLIETTANAGAANTINNVEFFLNGQIFAWDSKLPYNTTVGGLPPGLYSATVRVTDNLGAATTSAPIAFRVTGCDVFCNGFED
jgi:acetyl esterase/lipase